MPAWRQNAYSIEHTHIHIYIEQPGAHYYEFSLLSYMYNFMADKLFIISCIFAYKKKWIESYGHRSIAERYQSTKHFDYRIRDNDKIIFFKFNFHKEAIIKKD